MKTPIFEDYFFYLVKLPKFGHHILVGAVLCCIPIAHFFAFGYLYQLTSSIHQNQRLELPEWTNWPQLFQDGLRFSVPWFFFWLCPLIIATVLKWGLEAISMDLFGSLFYCVRYYQRIVYSQRPCIYCTQKETLMFCCIIKQ